MEWRDLLTYSAILISIVTLIMNRIDKAKKDTKEENIELIKYQVKEIKDDVKDVLVKLDKYENEIDERIDKKIEVHELMYHKRSKKNDS